MTKSATTDLPPQPRRPAAAVVTEAVAPDSGAAVGPTDAAEPVRVPAAPFSVPAPAPFTLPVPAPQLSRLPGPLPSAPATATGAVPGTATTPATGGTGGTGSTVSPVTAGAPVDPASRGAARGQATGATAKRRDPGHGAAPMVSGATAAGLPPMPGVHDVTGPARLDQRGGRILAQLRPGDVAVIDMIDIDLDTARALVSRRPAAVVNASSSTTGRAPGMGPVVLQQAGIRLVDDVGSHLLALVDDGDAITVAADGRVMRGERQLASGRIHDATSVALAARQGRAGLKAQLAAYGACVPVVFEEERHLLLSPVPVEPAVTQTVEQFPPVVGTLLRDGGRRQRNRARAVGRAPAVVVLPGPRALADARSVARFARGVGALVIAAGEGARVATTARLRPDVVVGDGRELSEQVLGSGAVAVHLAGPRTSDADISEARARLRRLGVGHAVWRTGLDPDDAAVVLAVSINTAVVVLAGDRRGLLEFAEQKALGMAGGSLTRAAWGHRLVDASVARRLLRPPMRWASALVVAGLGTTALAGALALVASGADVAGGVAEAASVLTSAVTGIFGDDPLPGTP